MGRISYPSYNERNLYQNRGLDLSAVIYLDVYDFDEQRDILVKDGIQFKINGVTSFRNEVGEIAYLKIPVTEK
jgi:hypothetical protein